MDSETAEEEEEEEGIIGSTVTNKGVGDVATTNNGVSMGGGTTGLGQGEGKESGKRLNQEK